MVSAASRELENLKVWAAKTGIPDLAPQAINRTLAEQGAAIWEEEFLKKKRKIDAIVARYTYLDAPLQYTGSMVSGWRGKPKGKVHFDPKEFDVDLYVVHVEEFERVAATRRGRQRAKIFPDSVHTPRLLELSDEVAAALGNAFPEVRGIEKSTIVLRRHEP
jgi:hypothetical protein